MQFFTQLLLLVSTVSAVNINLYPSAGQCSGDFVVCTNVNVGTCCGVSSGQAKGAIYFTGLPNPALVRTYGRGEFCNNLVRSDRTTSPNWCVFNLPNALTGGHWEFTSKHKRGVEAREDAECMRPDTGFVQGRQFNLTTLDDKAFDNFMEFLQTSQPSIPAQFLDSEVVSSEGSAVAM